ncbi:hypothetical protein BHE74_00054526, partial [Ensete ventricosum]
LFDTSRVESSNKETSKEGLRVVLDLISEVKAKAHTQALRYKKTLVKLYDQGICPRGDGLGDLVLYKAEVSNPIRSQGKLASNWEGLY